MLIMIDVFNEQNSNRMNNFTKHIYETMNIVMSHTMFYDFGSK